MRLASTSGADQSQGSGYCIGGQLRPLRPDPNAERFPAKSVVILPIPARGNDRLASKQTDKQIHVGWNQFTLSQGEDCGIKFLCKQDSRTHACRAAGDRAQFG